MHEASLLLTLFAGLATALACGYVTQRLGLSPIVGYVLAGVLVGEHTPGFVANRAFADQFAELGVILLMFGVGLHFHLRELLAVRKLAIPGAVGQSLVATGLGAVVATSFGWSWTAGVVYGLAISVASTVVLTRVLADNQHLHTPTGHVAVGWLVVEDLFTVLVLVLLPALFGGAAVEPAEIPKVLGLATLKIALLVVFTLLVGARVIPWLLGQVAATRSRELFILTVLTLALGIAVGAAELFGASMALGAFLAGLVVGRSDFSLRAASEALPMRDAFAVLFFVSVGMMFDPKTLVEAPGETLATLAIVLLGKPLAALAIVRALGHPLRLGVAVAVALAQIGEFSFILAALGVKLGILPQRALPALVAAAILSIGLNPLLYRWAHRWAARLRAPREPGPHLPVPTTPQHRAILVGYGPVGRTLARLLRDNGVEPVIVEMNLETVHGLRQQGIHAVYGDARHPETLDEAGVTAAGSLILTSAGMTDSEEVIRLARERNPDVRVLARTTYLREQAPLCKAGADQVFAAEGEVALAMTEAVLRGLGATAEQIDRERDRLHGELLGGEARCDLPQV